MSQSAIAYGVRYMTDKGMALDIKSVSPTRRGAIVNFLYVRERVRIVNDWSEEKILRFWKNRVTKSELVRLSVSVIGVENV